MAQRIDVHQMEVRAKTTNAAEVNKEKLGIVNERHHVIPNSVVQGRDTHDSLFRWVLRCRVKLDYDFYKQILKKWCVYYMHVVFWKR